MLGGGGVRGATEVGMIRALLEEGIRPDLVVGTSIGAINGAILAADPEPGVVARLQDAWDSPTARDVYGEGAWRQLGRLARTRTHFASPEPLRRLLVDAVGADATFEDLAVPLRVVAASIERAAEHWFDSGPLVEAVLASASPPGVLPPVRVGDEHFVDGGIVNSIPIAGAVRAGAKTVYVLQVGRVEEPLRVPREPVATAKVAFEIARRHRFADDLANLPAGVTLHVLPSGGGAPGDNRLRALRSLEGAAGRMERAYVASRAYLADPRPASRQEG